jgi:hypothetical protein
MVIRLYHLLDAARERSLTRPLRFRLNELLRGHLLMLAGAAASRLVVSLVHVRARRAGLGGRLRRGIHIRRRMDAHVLSGADRGLAFVAATLTRVPLRVNLRLGPLVERATGRLSMTELRLRRGNLGVTRGIIAAGARHQLGARVGL